MDILNKFAFDEGHAALFIDSFHKEMVLGLRKEKSSLKMLSSFVRRPSGREKGRFLAVDLGGSNFRVMAVELNGDRTYRVLANSSYSIPKELTTGEGERLFDFLASSVDSFLSENHFSRSSKYGMGFTFSFPVDQTGIKSGNLIRWTKGFSASGVVDRDVVCLLESAFKGRNINCISIEALANDTVGTLMAKSYGNAACDVGMILGTGTNACYPEERERGGMVINMECGNFNGFAGTDYDKELDRASNNKGEQLFEKAVSGMYLGEVFRLALCDALKLSPDRVSRPYSISSKDISQIAAGAFDFETIGLKTSSDVSLAVSLAEVVSKRSARLAAAVIASVILWRDRELKNEHVVAIDGSLFEKCPGYSEEMSRFLKKLLENGAKKVSFELAKDGSGVGAAIIAAVASCK